MAMMTSRKSSGRVLCLAVVLVTTLTACGGSDVAERLAEASSGQDVEVTLADDGSFKISTDEGAMQLGVNERPDWLPSDFYLPPDFEFLGSSSTTQTGTYEFAGISPSLSVDGMLADLREHLVNAGYELLNEDDFNQQLVFAKGGIGLITLDTTEGMLGYPDDTGLSAVIEAQANLDEARLDYVAASTTQGAALVVVDGAEYRSTGECLIHGRNASYSADDGTANFQIDTTVTPAYVAGTIADFGAEPPVFYSLDSTLPEGDKVEFQRDESGFSAKGPMRNGIDTAQDLVSGSFEITCG